MASLVPLDVVVVGAGLGGSAFCARLSERAPHLCIVCLERGDSVDRSAMPAYRPDWQRSALGTWATSPNVRLSAQPAVVIASDGHPTYPPTVGDNMAIALGGADKARLSKASMAWPKAARSRCR